jgi:hypothetical protein
MDDNMYLVLIRPIDPDALPDPDSGVPGYFILTQNYPNPFNPETTIPYEVQKTGHINITVYNVLGQSVRVLVDEVQNLGQYQVIWDGCDVFGMRVASGIYFYRLKQGEFAKTRRMILMR